MVLIADPDNVSDLRHLMKHLLFNVFRSKITRLACAFLLERPEEADLVSFGPKPNARNILAKHVLQGIINSVYSTPKDFQRAWVLNLVQCNHTHAFNTLKKLPYGTGMNSDKLIMTVSFP